MKETSKKTPDLSPADLEFLDDFSRQWNDSLARMHPLVDTSPTGIKNLYQDARHHRHKQLVHRRTWGLSLAASIALLLSVGLHLYQQPGLSTQPGGRIVAESPIPAPIQHIAPIVQPTPSARTSRAIVKAAPQQTATMFALECNRHNECDMGIFARLIDDAACNNNNNNMMA